MKQRILHVLFVVCLLLGLMLLAAGTASAEDSFGTCGENLTWSFVEETGTLTIYGTGEMADWDYDYPSAPWQYYSVKTVVIEHGVTSIGDYAFEHCDGLTSVSIPQSVTSIGDYAFFNCRTLPSISIPESVTSIGMNAFWCCDALEDVYITDVAAWCEISFHETRANPLELAENLYLNGTLIQDLVIPQGVSSIGANAFSNYAKLSSVTIADGVTAIGDYAFENCTGLSSVSIPQSVTSIGAFAFRNCSALPTVELPNSVTEIGYMAFADCTSLTSAPIPGGMTYIAPAAFENCTSLTSVSIPNNITEIGYGAFRGCTGLTSVSIPGSVVSFGTYIFADCSALSSVTLSEGLTSLGDAIFENCTALTSIELPQSLTTIDDGAFTGCIGLTSVSIPENVTSIKSMAFQGCSGLTSVSIPSGVTSIGSSAFYDCTGLLSVSLPEGLTTISTNAFRHCASLLSVTIPDSVTTIDDYAFYQCFALPSVAIPPSVNTIGYYAFFNCTALKDVHISDLASWCGISFDSSFGNPLYHARNLYLNGVKVLDLVIPEGVSTVRPYAFSYCSFLTSLTLPESLKTIESSAFYKCSGLTSVSFPSQLTTIGGGAFAYCSGLTSVTIPNGVTSIGNIAFHSCSGLTSVTIPPSVTFIDNSAFQYCSNLTDVCISDVAAWCAITFGDHWANPTQHSKRLLLNGEEIVELVIPEGVSSIGDYAFMCCSGLTSVRIPEGVTYIGEEAFYECSGLRSVNIPEGVEKIGWNAFRNCSRLPSVSIPSSVTAIDSFAFFGCDGLTQVEICDLTAWCNITFEDNQANPLHCAKKLVLNGTEIQELVIPDDVTSICDYAFVYCKNLTSVTIPQSVCSIGEYAFLYCTGLSSVTIPDSVSEIGWSAFSDCSGLSSVTIPDSVTKIASSTFSDCSSLSSVIIPESVTSIQNYAFYNCTSLKKVVILNPSCAITNASCIELSADGVIYGYPSSTAQTYAQKYGYAFLPLCNCGDYDSDYVSEEIAATCTEAGGTRLTCKKCGYVYTDTTIAALGHSLEYTNHGDMTHTAVCANCDFTETVACVYRDGVCDCGLSGGPSFASELQFSHSLSLDNDISINFIGKGEQLDAYETFYLECTMPVYEGNERVGTQTVRIEPVFNGINYKFMLTGVTAKMMNDEIEAVFRLTRNGMEYYSKTDVYSVAEYAYSRLNDEAYNPGLKTVCANLLRYGARSQLQFAYRTDALVDAAMTETHKSYLTDLSTLQMDSFMKMNQDHDAPTVAWKSATLELGNKVIMCLIVNLSDYEGDVQTLKMRLSYALPDGTIVNDVRPLELYNEAKGYYAVAYDVLRATEMRSVVTAAIYEGETRVSRTVEYSIESYGACVQDAAIKELCLAMLAYGDAANEFIGA